jgi:predicted class III extradiol MEMO1 family dioxygenase
MPKTKKKLNTTIHRVLGKENLLTFQKKKYIEIKDNIKIIKHDYNSKRNKIQILASTIPHAGFEYSGLHGLFIVDELLKYNNKNITILWFKHNQDSNTEHSLENVRKLVKLLKPNIKINKILITKETMFSEIKQKIKGGLLVSTDFSHHNYGNPLPMKNVWENDKKFLTKKLINDNSNNKGELPCGNQPLRILTEFIKNNKLSFKLLGYSNSIYKEVWWNKLKKENFNGVTYASLGCFKPKNKWLFNIESKLLAYPHLKWVESYLSKNNSYIDNGLYWSPLKKIKGSCFVSITDLNNKTISCFGYWETSIENNNILNCMKQASLSVKTKKWNDRNIININNIPNNYKIHITLIEPIKYWTEISNKKSVKKNLGYVYLKDKKVGMTYLPSVWGMLKNRKQFLQNLKEKQLLNYPDLNGWNLYQYNSISWILY